MKQIKIQLDKIRNAKTRKEASEACDAIISAAYETYSTIELAAAEAYDNWKPDYESQTKEELIKLLKENNV